MAEALDTGRDLEPVAVDIMVLFVDLRGYTAHCEPREPHEIFFATTNRFAATVSAVIQRHGGAIVEFSGDGLMATFERPNRSREGGRRRARGGPPRSPSCSLQRRLVLTKFGRRRHRHRPRDGGHLPSADCLIWTAVGNKVNLAARLQVLTRELHALVVIDAEMHAARR